MKVVVKRMREKNKYKRFKWRNLKERDNLKDTGVDGSVLKYI